ncbi:MAG: hypothetical protein ACXVB1_00080 [Pseudobdellovibrionaceae bacterium]
MRVNVEEGAWKRIYRLADLKGCSVREALGTVGCLWAQSQDLVKTHGTREEIIEWASLFKISENEIEMWITSLEKARFISANENGLFCIHGNDIQLEAIAKKSSRASKGGQALKKKMKELKRLKAGLKPTASKLGEAPGGSIQFNSRHYNSIQFNSNQSEAELAEISQEPTFLFLESMAKDEIQIEPGLVTSIIKRIYSDIHPLKTEGGPDEATELLLGDLTTVDGLKWFLKSEICYREYVRKKKIKKICGFTRFASEWPKWLPQHNGVPS